MTEPQLNAVRTVIKQILADFRWANPTLIDEYMKRICELDPTYDHTISRKRRPHGKV